MDYNKLFAHGKKETLFNETASGLFKFSEETPNVTGKLLNIEKFRKNIFSRSSNRYTIDTGGETTTFFLSGATDRKVAGTLIRGEVYSITFLGQKELKNGRRMNNFHIEHLIDAGDPIPQEKPEGREKNGREGK
jgi:hypothetical protein